MPETGSSAEQWRGRYYEDFAVGARFASRLGRTISETDNAWFTLMTMNTNQVHFNDVYAGKTRFGRPLVASTLTLAVVVGLSVADTSENAVANLAWESIELPNPVYVGDTLWAESEVMSLRESRSNSDIGIVSIRTRGINQRREVVIEYTRTFMVPKRHAAIDAFPGTDSPWSAP